MPDIMLPMPHPGQRFVLENKRRRNMIIAGRRWRKTTLAMSQAVIGAVQGLTVFWGSPTYKQTEIGWWETQKAVRNSAEFTKGNMVASFPGGGRIIFRSLDIPENSKGYSPQRVILDEAGDLSEEAYYEVVLPMLIDNDGEMWIIGTPRGKNWLYLESLNFQARSDYCLFVNAPSLGCDRNPLTYELERIPHPLENPDIKFSEVQNLYNTTPWHTFQQEVIAVFTDSFGSVFGDVASVVQFGLVGHISQLETPDGLSYVGGLDLARVNDYTVASVFRTDGKQMAIYRFNGLSWEAQIERVISITEEYKCSWSIDSTNIGAPIIERLKNLLSDTRLAVSIEEVYFTPQNKKSLIDGLIVAIEKKNIELLDDAAQYKEMTSYTYKETPTKLLKTSAPKGQHDDIVIANALAVKQLGFAIPAHSSDITFEEHTVSTTRKEYFSYSRA